MKRVVVIGGGVVGAACAYHLARAGCPVLLLDRGRFGAGCSHANCGFVCPSHVLPLAVPGAVRTALTTLFQCNSPLAIRAGVVLRNPGWFLAFARRCTQPHMLAAGEALRGLLASSRALFDDWMRDEAIECEWQTNGLLFVFRSRPAFAHYAEIDALLRERFATPARRFEGEQLTALEPALRSGLAGGWLYESDAHLRPDRLMAELRRVLGRWNVEIREDCPATRFVHGHGAVTAVQTPAGDVTADAVVIAAGAWSPHLTRELGIRLPIQPGKGYSLSYPRPATCPTIPMIFEEDRVAVTPFRTGLRIGSTMEFAGYDESMTPRRLGLLTNAAAGYLRETPSGPATESRWGWRPMTPDGLPRIGVSPTLRNAWVAAGHGMLGLSLAPATGKLVAELVTGAVPHLDPAPFAPR